MKTKDSFLSKRNIATVLVVVALLTAAFFYSSPVSFFARSIVFKISAPIMEKFSGWGRFFGADFFSSRKFLFSENQRLKAENHGLVLKLGFFISLEQENKELKALLKIKEERPFFEFISARPIGFVRDIQDEYIFISKGVKDWIHSDLWVLDAQNVFVGRVIEAYQNSSKVKLATSASETINGILSKTGIRVLIRGNGFREFLVDLVPENIEVNEGDEIMAVESWEYAGLNLMLGKVVEVGPTGARVFKSVKAIHYFDPQSLEPVFVVKKP